MLEQRGAKVLLFAQAPLRRVLQDSFPAVQVLEEGESPPADFCCPLMSLPYAFKTTLESIPASVPYLSARNRPLRPGRIGVAWSGNPEHLNDRWRSIRPELLTPLDSFEFQSLPRSGDMADTAAAMSRMDLVISVDTAAAHLAGALGKPVWVLLPYVADWRWLSGRADSPWYPSATLFRQPAPGDWETVLRQVAEKLAKGLISRI